jgi:glycerol-3-phosphate cytidylyltransferase
MGLFIGYLYIKNSKVYILVHKKHFFIGLFFSLMFLITTYLKFNRVRLGIDFPGIGVGLTLISSGLLPLTLFFLLAKYNPTNCVKLLSNISLELYLTHNLMISLLKKIILYNNLVGLILVLITSFGAAYILKTSTTSINIYWKKKGLINMPNKKGIIGYTTGVYDMFHIGHLNVIRNAKALCDYLIVGVSTDELVEQEKNKTPIIPFDERCSIVRAIKYVDEVVPQINKDKFAAWQKYKFDKMFVGSDWQGTPTWQNFEKQFKPLGVDIVYLPHTNGISSTKLTDIIKNVLEENPK